MAAGHRGGLTMDEEWCFPIEILGGLAVMANEEWLSCSLTVLSLDERRVFLEE